MTSGLETRLRTIEDELAIRALAARFTDCANERNFAAFEDLWSAQAVWEIGPPVPARAEGVDAIVRMLRSLLGPQIFFIQIDGDGATARFVERERGKGRAAYCENLAVYNDAFVRETDRKWRCKKRSYTYRFLDDNAPAGRVFPQTGGQDGASAEAAARGVGIHA